MENKNKTFIWSDGWCLEKDKAWFVCGMSNMLFCIDINSGNCSEVAYIPDSSECTYRLTPYCLKYEKDIFCIPGISQNIWSYNLDNKSFTKIVIDKPEELQLVSQFWIWKDMIMVVSANWNKIIEISISQKVVKKYYTICEEDKVQKSVLVDDSIFMLSSTYSRIYQFNLITKKTKMFSLSCDKKRLFTICFDGKKFWLSGYQREVHIWDKENNNIITINTIPSKIKMYDTVKDTDIISDSKEKHSNIPIFNNSVAVGNYIWFIPIYDDNIIYINNKNAKVSVFEICEEDEETKENVFLAQLWGIAKYLLEYVKNDRYIGLFVTKYGRILEIDVKNMNYCWKEYYLQDKCFFQLGGYKKLYYEGVDDVLYGYACQRKIRKLIEESNSNDRKVGTRIYKKTIEENCNE